MQIAEILSDLASLRACDYDAALALVSSHKNEDSASASTSGVKPLGGRSDASSSSSRTGIARHASVLEGAEDDPDLQRALDLVDLHYRVKQKHMQGPDTGLQQARADVSKVMEGLGGGKK